MSDSCVSVGLSSVSERGGELEIFCSKSKLGIFMI